MAFHENADQAVAPQARAYREGLLARTRLTQRLGVVLPAVGVQALFTRLANTDVRAQLAYEDRIRAYHARLRAFYYPYLFNERPFIKADFDKAPIYSPE